MKKLTLRAHADVIDQARELAQRNGTTVSSLFERFVRLLARRRRTGRSLGPLAQGHRHGRSAQATSSREILADALLETHGLADRPHPDHFPRSSLPVLTPAEFLAAHCVELK